MPWGEACTGKSGVWAGDWAGSGAGRVTGTKIGPAGEAGRKETGPQMVISNEKKISNEERFAFYFILMYKKLCHNGISHL